jgi:hypothetical protein
MKSTAQHTQQNRIINNNHHSNLGKYSLPPLALLFSVRRCFGFGYDIGALVRHCYGCNPLTMRGLVGTLW